MTERRLAAAAALALALGLAACVTTESDLLVVGPVLRSCDEAATRVSDHQACAFVDACALPLPEAPSCCAELVTCTGGTLSVASYCDSACVACAGDRDCPAGERLCDGTVCVPCTDPQACAPCADGTVPVVRNDCSTCECGPASQCNPDPGAPACADAEQCYPGQRCGAGCQPDEPGCCLDVCAQPGCASPAPLGCDTPCPPELGCETCQATGCRCDGMVWTCDAVCAPTTNACFFPR
ncbi:MAG TPA: hypothetical protein VHE35_18020 [Kofleriaceae bacterium]|nr:hypothetical protein [Kofleriaceae bacterium]